MANYPVPYTNNYGYSGIGQQLYPQYPQLTQPQAQPVTQTSTAGPGLIWVDGEVGAKAYQMPAGWPSNQPIALWDTNDTVIYLKSTNPMGMPMPLQKAHYTLEGIEKQKSGDAEHKPDMSEYVRKEDLDRMKQDLIDTIGQLNSPTSGAKRTTTKGE